MEIRLFFVLWFVSWKFGANHSSFVDVSIGCRSSCDAKRRNEFRV
jgi:hypothetical protein